MDSGFGVESYGFSGFDSFTPGNMGINWNIAQEEKQEFTNVSGKHKRKLSLSTKKTGDSGKKDALEPKNATALKSHCEAERRRRERINAHFATLRNFVPSADKMDKASLLAEVISQLKQLKKQANESTKELLIPTHTNEVTVEPCNDYDLPNGFSSFKASISCDYKPELIQEIRRALDAFKLTITKPEISTLGDRVKSVFIITAQKEETFDHKRDSRFTSSIRNALCSVLEKISSSEDLLNKRRKVYNSSSSS